MSVLFKDRETGAYGEFCVVESRIKEAVDTFPLPEALGLAIIETKIGTAGQSKPFFVLEICESPGREAVKAQHEKVLSNLRRDGLVYFTRNLTLREGFKVFSDYDSLLHDVGEFIVVRMSDYTVVAWHKAAPSSLTVRVLGSEEWIQFKWPDNWQAVCHRAMVDAGNESVWSVE